MRAGNWKTVRMVAHYSAGASCGRAGRRTRAAGRPHSASSGGASSPRGLVRLGRRRAGQRPVEPAPNIITIEQPAVGLDTHGYTEINFAAFVMIGMRF